MPTLDCPLCSFSQSRIIFRDKCADAIFDGFPVTPLHALIIPVRHVDSYFDLSEMELNAVNNLIHKTRNEIINRDPSVTGFNIGMNCGHSAGQTIFHCHVHLIPRRDGDVKDPRGGVRHTIPGKGYY